MGPNWRRAAALGIVGMMGIAGSGCAPTTDAHRQSPGPIVPSSAYDYAPTIMEDGVYRMWWCGQIGGGVVPGDDILYAESSSLDGPFHARGSTSAGYQRVFDGTGTGSFDGIHTCDPSILRVDGTYYMYYGGLGPSDQYTDIGVATSPDGFSWTRLNGGNPIVTAAQQQSVNLYGAGQPSAVYLDGRFYLLFTDTTGAASLANGAGQYVYRSADPAFQSGVEVLTAAGFAPVDASNARGFILSNAFSADWQYIDALDMFALAKHNAGGTTTVELWRSDLSGMAFEPLQIPNTWSEGPGIVSRPDKHAVAPRSSQCDRVPFDLVNASANNGAPQQLRHVGVDIVTGRPCADLAESTVERLYEGYAMQAPGLPLALVVGGERLQVDSTTAAVVDDLTNNYIGVTSAVYHQITPGSSLRAGQLVIGAPGRPAAFVLDDNRAWPVNHLELVTDAGSSITTVSPTEFDAHPLGPSLFFVR